MNNMELRDYVHLQQLKRIAISEREEQSDFYHAEECLVSAASAQAGSTAAIENSDSLGPITDKKGSWERVFLSNFYYNFTNLHETQHIYKLNITDDNHAYHLAKYLSQHNYGYYFYDMTISSSSSDIVSKSCGYTFSAMTDILKEQNISDRVTIAKWWDPSKGGNDVWNSKSEDNGNTTLDAFNKVLQSSVVQPLSGHNKLCEITTGGKQMRLSDGTLKEIPDNGFTIAYSVDKISNNDNSLLYYDLKRSGDHGQIMYLKHLNSNLDADKKMGFLITGDSMCVTKALLEKVPVLFKLYSNSGIDGNLQMDLYFYNPIMTDVSRERLILQHKAYFTDIAIINERIETSINQGALAQLSYMFELNNENKIEIKTKLYADTVQNTELIQKNYLELASFIRAYDFFIKPITNSKCALFMIKIKEYWEKIENPEEIKQFLNNLTIEKTKVVETGQDRRTTEASIIFSNRTRERRIIDNENKYQADLEMVKLNVDENAVSKYGIRIEYLKRLARFLKNMQTVINNVSSNTSIKQAIESVLSSNYGFLTKEIYTKLIPINTLPDDVSEGVPLNIAYLLDIGVNTIDPEDVVEMQSIHASLKEIIKLQVENTEDYNIPTLTTIDNTFNIVNKLHVFLENVFNKKNNNKVFL
jgi:hypothetical protein